MNSIPDSANGQAVLAAAAKYLVRGWACIPLRAGEKTPAKGGWQQLRLKEADIPASFANGENLGVLLGEPSSLLVDVDLDHDLALELADEYLPPTGAVFGRAGRQGERTKI